MFKIKQLIILSLVFSLVGCATSDDEAPVVNHSRLESINTEQYRVQQGDTLYSIAWASNLDYRQLAKMNHLKAPYSLRSGQVLRVKLPVQRLAKLEKPLSLSQSIKKSSKNNSFQLDAPKLAQLSEPHFEKKLSTKSMDNKATLEQNSRDRLQLPDPGVARIPAFSANEINSQKSAQIYDTKSAVNEIDEQHAKKDLIFRKKSVHFFLWPTQGKVIGQSSEGQLGNKGLDITGQYGQPVKASESGTVVYSGSGLRGYGNLIIIKHNASYLSAYAHNSELMVSEGVQVKAGQEIALMGRAPSGQVMLHFEIRRDGKPINPTQYLR